MNETSSILTQNPSEIISRPLSVIILAFNEEVNLPECLESITDLNCDIFVVDSGSTDRTREITEQFDALIFEHPFETHAKQWKWALENLPISAEWVLALDADQRLTPELRNEISKLVDPRNNAGTDKAGYFIKRQQIFRGKWIKHGGYYPKYLLKLFRRSNVSVDENDLVDHHFRVAGRVGKLRFDIVEDNHNEADISVWIDKHNRYAVLQAREEISRSKRCNGRVLNGSIFGTPDERVLWRKQMWNKLPLYIRPTLYFAYRYFLRLGFLDGKEGFIFHFLQAFWYRLLVDINREELKRIHSAGGELHSNFRNRPSRARKQADTPCSTSPPLSER